MVSQKSAVFIGPPCIIVYVDKLLDILVGNVSVLLLCQGAAVLNMVEGFLGAETFRDGVRVSIRLKFCNYNAAAAADDDDVLQY